MLKQETFKLNPVKSIIAIILITILSTTLSIAQEPGSKMFVTRVHSLHGKPDLSSTAIEALIPGDEVTILYIEETISGKDEDALARVKTPKDNEGYIPFSILSKRAPRITTPVIRSVIVPKKKYVTANVLNVRSGPGTSNSVVGVVRRNDLVEIVYYSDKTELIDGVSDRWANIRFGNNVTGYVFGGFLSDEKSAPPKTPEYNDDFSEPEVPRLGAKLYVRPSRLQLRKEPDKNGRVVGTVSQNSRVKVINHSPNKELIQGSYNIWVEVDADDKKGWVFGGFLSVSEGRPLNSDRLDKVYTLPLRPGTYRRTSNYGARVHPITKKRRFHTGSDFGASSGTPIYSVADGTVLRTMNSRGYGKLTIVQHPNNMITMYAHQVRFGTKQGAKVKGGEKIGYVGTTGMSTGNHLHLEVRDKLWGSHFDPDNYIDFPEKR